MQLEFGSDVVGMDGAAAGVLERALADPADYVVTHLVVRSPLLSEEALVPAALADRAADGRLTMRVAAGELESLPRYYDGRTNVPPAARVDATPVEIVGGPGDGLPELADAARVAHDAIELSPDVTTASGRLRALDVTDGDWRIVGGLVRDAARRETRLSPDEVLSQALRVGPLARRDSD